MNISGYSQPCVGHSLRWSMAMSSQGMCRPKTFGGFFKNDRRRADLRFQGGRERLQGWSDTVWTEVHLT